MGFTSCAHEKRNSVAHQRFQHIYAKLSSGGGVHYIIYITLEFALAAVAVRSVKCRSNVT